MSRLYEFDVTIEKDWKVNKRSKDYKRLKELFPECDYIFTKKDCDAIMNTLDDDNYNVLRFFKKNFDEGFCEYNPKNMILEKPLRKEVYKLVHKLTNGEWEVYIHILETHCPYGSCWGASGEIKEDAIHWFIDLHDDEEGEEMEEEE